MKTPEDRYGPDVTPHGDRIPIEPIVLTFNPKVASQEMADRLDLMFNIDQPDGHPWRVERGKDPEPDGSRP